MSNNLFNVFVIWRGDEDNFMFTLLRYEDTPQQRQAMLGWTMRDYTTQAHDVEYPDEPNRIAQGDSYECIAVFEGNIRFIF